MAAKPAWHGRLDRVLADLNALPCPWITRGTVEFLLGVGPRRAQQIMRPCAVEQIGTSLVADRRLLIQHLASLARGEAVHYELQRQRKLAASLERLRNDWLSRPKVLVEAPVSVVDQRLEDLPAGVELAPGRITIRFTSSAEALQKMLALAMAIGKDIHSFEDRIALKPGSDAADVASPAAPVY